MKKLTRNEVGLTDIELSEYSQFSNPLNYAHSMKTSNYEYNLSWYEYIYTDRDVSELIIKIWNELEVHEQLFILLDQQAKLEAQLERIKKSVEDIKEE